MFVGQGVGFPLWSCMRLSVGLSLPVLSKPGFAFGALALSVPFMHPPQLLPNQTAPTILLSWSRRLFENRLSAIPPICRGESSDRAHCYHNRLLRLFVFCSLLLLAFWFMVLFMYFVMNSLLLLETHTSGSPIYILHLVESTTMCLQ